MEFEKTLLVDRDNFVIGIPQGELAVTLPETLGDVLEQDLSEARWDGIPDLLQDGCLASGEPVCRQESLQSSKLAQLECASPTRVQVALATVTSYATSQG